MRRVAFVWILLCSLCHATEVQRDQLPPQIAQWETHVCRVTSIDGSPQTGHGSGVYLGRGLVLTAYHVVERPTNRLVVQFVGDDQRYEGRFNGGSPSGDFAFIQVNESVVESTGRHGVLLAQYDARQGDTVYRAGFPMAGDLRWTRGTVVRPYDGGAGVWCETSYGSISGESGGPVFAEDGTLLGALWGSGPQTTMSVRPTAIRQLLAQGNCLEPLTVHHTSCYGGSCYSTRPYLLPWRGRTARQIGQIQGQLASKQQPQPSMTPSPQQKPDVPYVPRPETPTQPAEQSQPVTIDYDKLADALVRNHPDAVRGPPGPHGPRGSDGMVDVSSIRSVVDDVLNERPQMLRIRDGEDTYTVTAPLGEPLRIQVTGALNASGGD